MQNPNLFVISGGPGAGKTTVLAELERLGFQCAPEVARQIIQEQMETGGTALPWGDREAYTDLMLQRSIASYREHTPAPRITFFDRGIPDTLCYARLIGLRETSAVEDASRRYRYASRVFLAPPWEEIYKMDEARKQDYEEAKRTYEVMTGVYQEFGYQTIELPKIAVPARARFILDEIAKS